MNRTIERKTPTEAEREKAAGKPGEIKAWASATGSVEWLEVSKELPPLDDMVWLYDPERGPWIGARADDGTCWLWANSYGRIWWNGVKWDGDKETDDDYKPTHWLRLPTPPNDRTEPLPLEAGVADTKNI